MAPGEVVVVTIGKFQSGDAPNVIADKAELGASIRTTTEESCKMVEARVTAVGASAVFDAPMMSASEDFSYYTQVAPECFLTLGAGNGVANHNPKFNLAEKALQNGVMMQVQLILDYLN